MKVRLMLKTKHFAVLLATAATLAGCSSTPEPATVSADAVTVADVWVKAADDGMTAGFGRLTNTGTNDARIVSATTPAATTVELHEVVSGGGAMTMRPKDGGFGIPAGADIELRPGGDHLMFMDLTGALRPGDDVEIVATFEDGSTLPITAQVRDFPGADEQYDPSSHG
jgi:copper(I)-binding protein